MLPQAFRVRNDHVGVVSIVSVAGELDIATAPTLQTALEHADTDGARHVLVDLTDTRFLETSGLRTLLRASQRMSAGGSLSIVCPNACVRRVFELTGTADLLALHDDRASALRWHERRVDTVSAARV